MPINALGLTYASYSSNKVLTAAGAIYLSETAIDQVFGAGPFFQYLFGKPLSQDGKYRVSDLQKKDRIRIKSAGSSIDIPLMTGKNNTGKSYSRYGTFDTTPQEGLGPAMIDWRQYGITASIDGFSERVAPGGSRESIIDLLKFTMDQAMSSFNDMLYLDLLATSKEFTTDLDGLFYWITASPITGTVAGIDRAANSFWRNQFNGASQFVTDASYSFAASGKQNWMKGLLAASLGPGVKQPDAIWTTRDIWGYLWDSLEDQKRYTNVVQADAGYKTLEFMGVPVYWDLNFPSGYAVFTNSDTFHVVIHKDANFKMGKFIEPANQDARTAKLIAQLNVVNDGPRLNGIHTSISA